MTHWSNKIWAIALAVTTAMFAGCDKPSSTPTPATTAASSQSTPQVNTAPSGSSNVDEGSSLETEAADDAASTAKTDDSATASESLTLETSSVPKATHEPRMAFSDEHAATCLIHANDDLPSMTVTDVKGTQHQLRQLLGENLTVVVFWTSEDAASREQFLRLEPEVVSQWAGRGVSVIAINVGDKAEQILELSKDAGEKLVTLVDPDSEVFSQFATQIVPRTYIVDARGKILWFDIEYSSGSRRELQNALAYYLHASS